MLFPAEKYSLLAANSNMLLGSEQISLLNYYPNTKLSIYLLINDDESNRSHWNVCNSSWGPWDKQAGQNDTKICCPVSVWDSEIMETLQRSGRLVAQAFLCGLGEVEAGNVFKVNVICTVTCLKASLLLQWYRAWTLCPKWHLRVTLELFWIYSDVTGNRMRPIGCVWFSAPSKQFTNKN